MSTVMGHLTRRQMDNRSGPISNVAAIVLAISGVVVLGLAIFMIAVYVGRRRSRNSQRGRNAMDLHCMTGKTRDEETGEKKLPEITIATKEAA